MMAVVLAIFDFANGDLWPEYFEQNKRRHVAAGLPVYGIEVARCDRPRTSADWFIPAEPRHVVWQKERLWNLCASRLPADVDKIAFVDADVTFCRPDWSTAASRALETCDWIQPFSVGDTVVGPKPAIARVFDVRTDYGAFGLAWCCRRDWLERSGGFYERAACPLGDLYTVRAMQGRLDLAAPKLAPAAYRDLRQYASRLPAARVGWIDGHASHLPHGSESGRSYAVLPAQLTFAGFDPRRDLAIDDNGLLAWSGDRLLEALSHRYFSMRKDENDGSDDFGPRRARLPEGAGRGGRAAGPRRECGRGGRPPAATTPVGPLRAGRRDRGGQSLAGDAIPTGSARARETQGAVDPRAGRPAGPVAAGADRDRRRRGRPATAGNRPAGGRPRPLIFGIGLSRTGTTTLNRQLNLLGWRGVHWPVDERTVREIEVGQLQLSLLDTYNALVDCALPIVAYRRYAQLYPSARFILTVRDVPDWLASIERHWRQADGRYDWAGDQRPHVRAARIYRYQVFGHLGFDAAHFLQVWDRHWRDVLLTFRNRPKRLLVYDVRDGWPPLCEFLGVDVPEAEMPWLNRGEP